MGRSAGEEGGGGEVNEEVRRMDCETAPKHEKTSLSVSTV